VNGINGETIRWKLHEDSVFRAPLVRSVQIFCTNQRRTIRFLSRRPMSST
jgi:hypothetical protein